jgi:hypothetical protein
VAHNLQVTDTANLRYLEATSVAHPSGTLGGLMICTHDNEELGALNGVLVEPASRRVRYFVVERPAALVSNRRYILTAETPAILDSDDRKLRVDAEAVDLERFDPGTVRAFSDDDRMAALFPSRPATF